MDPNTTLAQLRDAMRGENPDYEAARWLWKSLDGWLMRGGFLPQDWANAQEADKAALRAALSRPRYEGQVD